MTKEMKEAWGRFATAARKVEAGLPVDLESATRALIRSHPQVLERMMVAQAKIRSYPGGLAPGVERVAAVVDRVLADERARQEGL